MDRQLLLDGVAYADQWLAHQRQFREIPGMVVAIQHDDDVLLSQGYGFANLERQTPITPRHIFRIASHSKTFTATAIMQLVERGHLRLDDRVSAYLPWLAPPFTIRQLMNHVSGVIRDGTDATFWHLERPFPDLDELRALAPDSEVLEPNQQFKYSNVGYSLLGLVVAAATGQPYNDYVTQHIVDRLGLEATGPETHPSIAEQLVTAYTPRRPPLPRLSLADVNTRAMSPATGFYSTALDLCRYARAHYLGNEELLTDASKREMQQPYWVVENADASYGLGLAVQKIGARTMIGHGGGFPGHSTMTLIDPIERLVVVVLNNTHGPLGLASPLATTVVRILDYALAADSDTGGEPLAHPRERFTCRFMNMWTAIDIASFGKKLVALNPDEDNPTKHPSELEIVDANTLRISRTGGYGSPGERIRYERDSSGAITQVWFAGARTLPRAAFEAQVVASDQTQDPTPGRSA